MSSSAASVSFDSVKENEGGGGECSLFRKTPHPSKKQLRDEDTYNATTTSADNNNAAAYKYDPNDVQLSYGHNANSPAVDAAAFGKATTTVLEEVTNSTGTLDTSGSNENGAEEVAYQEEEKVEHHVNQEEQGRGADDEDAMKEIDLCQTTTTGGGGGDGVDEEWQAVCEKIQNEPPSSVSRVNLAHFTEAMKVNQDAKQSFEASFTSTRQALAEAFEGVVNQLKADTEQWSLALEARRVECTKLAHANYHRRQHLVNQLEENYHAMEKTHTQLVAAVMNEPTNNNGEEEGGDDDNSGQKDRQGHLRGATDENKPPGDAVDETDQEPSWEELLQFEPMRANTKLLMDAGDFMNEADCQIATKLDGVVNSLQACLEQFDYVAIDTYESMAAALDNEQDGIQQQMASNLTRRIDFEISVREQAEQSKNFFQHLMGSIRNAMCANASPAIGANRPMKRPGPSNHYP